MPFSGCAVGRAIVGLGVVGVSALGIGGGLCATVILCN